MLTGGLVTKIDVLKSESTYLNNVADSPDKLSISLGDVTECIVFM